MSSQAASIVPATVFVIGARHRLLVHGVLLIAMLLPLTLVDIPALVDYPNHLARIHVISGIETDTALGANYEVAWGAMPNLAMDLMILPLAGILPVEILGRMFIALTMLMLVGGTLALHRVLRGSIGLWSVGVYLFVYNHLLIMGFLNYLFASGIALALFAAWIASAGWRPWIRWTLFPAALAGLYFAHLFALAVYGICVTGSELFRLWPVLRTDWRAAARQGLVVSWQFLPAALLVLATMPEAADKDFLYGPFLAKVRALWSPALTYLKPIDVAIFLIAAAIPLAGLVTGRLTLARPLRLPLALLAVCAAAMPFWIQGTWGSIWYADLRLPIILTLLLVAGLRPRNVNPRIVVTVLCAGAVLLTGRIVDISLEWRRMDRDFAEFRTAARLIEPGASILPVQRRNVPLPAGETRFDYAYWHLPVLAIIDRSAFVPTLFTDPTKQPVRAAPDKLHMDTEFGAPIDVALLTQSADSGRSDAPESGGVAMQDFWTDWPENFDYVLITHFGATGNPLPDLLTSVHEGSFFTIYRVARH
jgi:hypothetical protein